MTLHEFDQLDEAEQMETVWKLAPMADFIEIPYRYVLYQMNGFYIELRYHMKSNLLTGISAFDDPAELEPYCEQLKSFQLNGKPNHTVTELRDQAIKMLAPETINMIMATPEDQLIVLSYSFGVQLRNQLDMWHTIVTDHVGNEIHPDDASLALIKEIWMLDK